MSDDEEIIDWRTEAAGVIHDIKDHVKQVAVSESLPSDETEIYLNLETKENDRFTVRLSPQGFAVTGKGFDNREDENKDEVQYFETPYSLLSSISKEFTNSFGNSLIAQLSKLEQQQ